MSRDKWGNDHDDKCPGCPYCMDRSDAAQFTQQEGRRKAREESEVVVIPATINGVRVEVKMTRADIRKALNQKPRTQ